MRFPQPVRVGDLLRRDVLQPVESQDLLGTVKAVVRDAHGRVEVVIEYGGLLERFGGVFGIGGRPIAVPLDAMVLLGQAMEVVAFKPDQLRRFPTFSAAGTTPVPPDTVLDVGLAKPSH